MLITKKQSIFKYISCAPYPLISDFILYLPLETVMKQYYHPFFSKQFFLFKSTSKDNLKLFFGFYHHTINQLPYYFIILNYIDITLHCMQKNKFGS